MRNHGTFLGLLTSFLIAGFALFANAQTFTPSESLRGLDPAYIEFVKAELASGFRADDTTVDPKYQGRNLEPFEVGYIEMPSERLNLEVASIDPNIVENHFYVPGTNHKMVRLYIHPDSEYLYQKLVDEFGYKGHYLALPTASTRTVLAWDPQRPNLEPIFLKLSLARKQLGLGRVVPGWEVRRSVRITETFNEDLRHGRITNSEVSIIDEVAGAYVKKSEGIGFYVDDDQQDVFEHGYIIRDASFIKRHQNDLVVPMFWLFAKGTAELPPIGAKWVAGLSAALAETLSGKELAENFNQFLANGFFKSFLDKNTPFMAIQGYAPQLHGQNVVLILDRTTLRIKKIYHRDLGSFKVDYRLRWIHNLPISRLRSELADKDFGLSWSAEKFASYISFYLYTWNLEYASPKDLREVTPHFDPSSLQGIISSMFNAKLRSLLGDRPLLSYIENSTPKDLLDTNMKSTEKAVSTLPLRNFINHRIALSQVVKVPDVWSIELLLNEGGRLANDGYLFTEYGLLYRDTFMGGKSEDIFIAFYRSNDDRHKLTINACDPLLVGDSAASGF